MIKKFDEFINENIFDGIGKRSKSGAVRKEDQGIDIGSSVLWSNTDVVVGNKELFTYTEAESFEKNGWRLPTQKEADELLTPYEENKIKPTKYSYDEDKQCFILSKENAKEIYLKKISNKKYTQYWYKKYTQYWVKNTETLNKFTIKKDNNFFPHTAYAMADDDDLCRIRLVRDI